MLAGTRSGLGGIALPAQCITVVGGIAGCRGAAMVTASQARAFFHAMPLGYWPVKMLARARAADRLVGEWQAEQTAARRYTIEVRREFGVEPTADQSSRTGRDDERCSGAQRRRFAEAGCDCRAADAINHSTGVLPDTTLAPLGYLSMILLRVSGLNQRDARVSWTPKFSRTQRAGHRRKWRRGAWTNNWHRRRGKSALRLSAGGGFHAVLIR